ncbi:hypothetical protein BJ322DRAFT_1010803 [Thelephora terrestris]|uniref:C2H2-type domain-containing protein n=1 Tax=Thelephora terrestris TaxID=56493 RepID=A0A9P6H8R9_9AGAM|nr:hypothetical protein BJ322DRAFT_1010803 [Thelephora terrestris]
MSQPQQIQVCDPQALGSPVDIEQPIIQAGLSVQVEESRRSRPPTYSAPVVDSDYAPSGESEVEDENDYDYGAPSNRKKNRSARVSCAAHPYLKPASKSKDKRRATLEIPVPVPGLTKNSRGRSVPTGTPGVVYVDGTRSFWCSVQNCNKMFSRGEHLKRHIKSIHTHDKDYRCECKNTFSRRDNLFQHMRTKGCQKWYEDVHGKSSTDGTAAGEDVEEDDDARVDRLVERMMNDAKIAQEKRIKACKRALAHS